MLPDIFLVTSKQKKKKQGHACCSQVPARASQDEKKGKKEKKHSFLLFSRVASLSLKPQARKHLRMTSGAFMIAERVQRTYCLKAIHCPFGK